MFQIYATLMLRFYRLCMYKYNIPGAESALCGVTQSISLSMQNTLDILCLTRRTLAGRLGIRSTNSMEGGHWGEEWGGRLGEKIVMIDGVHIYE